MKYIDNFLLKNLIQEIYLEEKQQMNESAAIEAIGTIAALGAIPFLTRLIKNYLDYDKVPDNVVDQIVREMKKDNRLLNDIKKLQSENVNDVEDAWGRIKAEIDKKLQEKGIVSRPGVHFNVQPYKNKIFQGLQRGAKPGPSKFFDKILGKH